MGSPGAHVLELISIQGGIIECGDHEKFYNKKVSDYTVPNKICNKSESFLIVPYYVASCNFMTSFVMNT